VDDETGAAFFRATHDHLVGSGFEHYEVSNFARSPDRRSRHNPKYWRHVPYLGLGPAAHSFLGRERWWNLRSVDRWTRALHRGESPEEGRETLTDDQVRLEAVWLGLRTSDGIPSELCRSFANGDRVVGDLVAEGLATVAGDRILPTVAGFLLSDRIPLRFE
jgi:oxygen-independent coproporphyrinogen III oxidase